MILLRQNIDWNYKMKRINGHSNITIQCTIYREIYDEESKEYCDEVEINLEVEGSVTSGEGSSWGYYGGSPGYSDDAEIVEIWEIVPVQGPPIYARAQRYEGDIKHYTPLYPINTVLVEWDEELSKNEEDGIKEDLCKAAKEEAGDAKVDAYLSARGYD